ncbi:MAG: hypothetical protein R3F14_32395 [Polyangiaceae bacterium]
MLALPSVRHLLKLTAGRVTGETYHDCAPDETEGAGRTGERSRRACFCA